MMMYFVVGLSPLPMSLSIVSALTLDDGLVGMDQPITKYLNIVGVTVRLQLLLICLHWLYPLCHDHAGVWAGVCLAKLVYFGDLKANVDGFAP